ncbi:hypothetical protein VRZ08_00970 [Rhodopseudomonas sp. G2_2311]|uniref:hypothetical protein n=1 Tax=Rhodopseudomonas sp. G2_2311 TaxID=3114287 RepID=UPI0039C5F3E3
MALRSYFVVMRDFGALGHEAIVDPNLSRSDVVRLICSGEYDNVVFVHHINAGTAFDVTDELMAEAFRPEDRDAEDTPSARRAAAEADRGMDRRRDREAA